MSDLKGLSNEQLVAAFVALSHKQGMALKNENTRRYNRLFDELKPIEAELRERGDDARRSLIPLLKATPNSGLYYQDAQTRFNAAEELDSLVPELARATLRDIAANGPRKYRGMAGMSLSMREQGIYKPNLKFQL
jgi:hypothetical protein